MTFYELCQKDVVSVNTGRNLGRVDDAIFEEETASITHIILYGKLKLFGILGREEDTLLPWSCIEKVGEDVLLVKTPEVAPPQQRVPGGFTRMFG